MAEKPKSEKWKGAKTRNLTAKQQEKAKRIVGGGRSEKVKADELKAARANTIDIGTTKWTTAAERKTAGQKGRGGLLTDSSGKALTGTVKLPSGKTATYVRGKRIGIVADKPKGGSVGRGGGATTSAAAVQKAKDKMGKAAGYGKGAGTPSNLTGTSGGMGGPARTPRQQSAEYRRQAQAKRAAGGRTPMASTPTVREGQRRTRQVGRRKVVEVYRNGSWLPLTGSRGGY